MGRRHDRIAKRSGQVRQDVDHTHDTAAQTTVQDLQTARAKRLLWDQLAAHNQPLGVVGEKR